MKPHLLCALVLPLAVGCTTTPASLPLAESLWVRAAHEPHDLRVMTFNIQSGAHGLDAVAGVIRAASPDIVALQEVDRGTRRSGGLDQARELATRAGLPHSAYFRATSLHGGDYGVAVLSRFPITSAKNYALPTPRMLEQRTVAHAVMDVHGQEVSVYITHLTNLPQRAAIRVREANAIARMMSADRRPKLVMGDLNDAPDSAAVLLLSRYAKDVFAASGVGPAETYPLPLALPDLRLDYVLASAELQPSRAFVLRKRVSDHYPIVADMKLPLRDVQIASTEPSADAASR